MLLGLAATASHTAIVWIIALAGLHFGARWNNEATEPYLQLASSFLILASRSGCCGGPGGTSGLITIITTMRFARSTLVTVC